MERIIQKIYLILGITVNWPLGAVSSPLDSFVVAESSVLRTTFSVKNPAYRQSAKRYGQDSSNTFTWSAYGEFYASIDAIEPRTNQNSLPFLVNHKQINNVGVNIALVRTHYSNGNTRANAGIMFGDYSRYNLGAEDMSLRNIYELNAGVKLLKNDNLWLDAGVFESYLGFESPLGVNNATLTRSMFAENSPYYLSGVRLQFTSRDSRILFSGYYLNGWQRMVRPNGMRGTAWGMHFVFMPTRNTTISYGTFWGGDGFKQQLQRSNYKRWFNDVYVLFFPIRKVETGVLCDYGIDYADSRPTYSWYTVNGFVKYKFTPRFSVTGRAERFSDPNYTVLTTFSPAISNATRFLMHAYSLNIDMKLNEHVTFRTEARAFESSDYNLVGKRSKPVNSTQVYTASLCVRF